MLDESRTLAAPTCSGATRITPPRHDGDDHRAVTEGEGGSSVSTTTVGEGVGEGAVGVDHDVTPEEASIDADVDQLLADFPPASTDDRTFLAAQFDRGLAWAHFPEGSGGLGLTPAIHQRVIGRLAAAGAPSPMRRNVLGYGMVAPTVVVHGTDEQRARYLRPLFICDEIWCQLFSEPGAGSDVAGLATAAVRDGDEWTVNGQKVWTTAAHMARFGLLLTRTDPAVPKHQGMTMFLVDMHAPGVEVRPLYQITGEAEFNEVFFSDAPIPDTARLGGVGEGWRVALTTLMNERVSIGGNVPRRGGGPMAEAITIWRERWEGQSSARAAVLRDRLMSLWVASEAARLTNLRSSQLRGAGTPGPDGSVAKVAFAELNQQIYELCIEMLGAEGTLHSSSYPKVRPVDVGIVASDVHKAFLRARANSIEGGTSEVMRNILGERVLGLAGEPRTDRDVAWRDVPRS
jgi:alkylation response protein AidB-like acyl-CoA dehydrogenase